MSHENPAVISDISNKVKNHFEDLLVVRCNKHTSVGMNIYIKYNIIKFDMVEQLEEYKNKWGIPQYVSFIPRSQEKN